MLILIDSREKPKAITRIIDHFQQNGIDYITNKLLFGDYMVYDRPKLVIDRKQNIAELAKNCTREHERFKREMELARMTGSRLIILVEQNRYQDRGRTIKVETLEDLILWSSPNTVVTGEKVYRVLKTWCARYPIEVQFCDKRSTGKRILEILGANDG